MSSEKVSVVLVGIGGYGEGYLSQVLDNGRKNEIELVGIVDPFASASARIDQLTDLAIPIYDQTDDFYKNHSADLAVISSPIHYHRPQTVAALEAGSNVLCEKPVGGCLADGEAMADAAKKAGKFLGIGYQMSFSDANLAAKQDILEGVYGRAIRFKTYTCWPRYESYYKRNNWAGRIKTDDGRIVNDSPLNNATAHYLHNMLFMAGGAINKSAAPAEIIANVCRAKEYENFDTAAMRVITDNGVEVLFYTTHSCLTQAGPMISLEFEKGVMAMSHADNRLIGKLEDGSTKDYGLLLGGGDFCKLWKCVDAVNGKGAIPCDIDTAMGHLMCVEEIAKLPIKQVTSGVKTITKENGDSLTYIEGIEDMISKCFDAGVLPSELGADDPLCKI